MKKFLRVLSLTLLVAICLSVLPVAVYAASGEDFVSGVNAINKDAPYATRKAAADALLDAYNGLSDTEKSEVAASYSALGDEIAALRAIEEKADAFLAAVAVLESCQNLNDKENVFETATAEGVYFDDESYPGVADALAQLEAVKTAVDNTCAFISAVDEATLVDETDYAAYRAALDLCEEYINLIDRTYAGADGAYSFYRSMASALLTKENYTTQIAALITEMQNAADYSSRKMSYERIKDSVESDQFIPDHPSVAGLDEAMEETEEYFRSCIAVANGFILAVNRITVGKDYAKGIIEAYAALDGVDMGVDGVSSAKSSFDSSVNRYNSAVRELNALLSGK